ncbi:MAG: hypothetical protein GTO02_05520 [Candidatus Dadabacteria bacterium]|nr:hypothetical protein [Candidatus Dadabacteria bacterium]
MTRSDAFFSAINRTAGNKNNKYDGGNSEKFRSVRMPDKNAIVPNRINFKIPFYKKYYTLLINYFISPCKKFFGYNSAPFWTINT